MIFLSLTLALALEQLRPFAYAAWLRSHVSLAAQWIRLHIDAGLEKQAWAAWCIAALLPSLIVAAVYWSMVEWGSWFLGLIWSVCVLYVCLGFRQFSHHFTQIRDALDAGDEDTANLLLARWQHFEAEQWRASTLIRHLIEYSVVAAHRHVFGVLYWYCIFAVMGFGPAGAVMYRLSEMVVYTWTQEKNIIEGEELTSSEPLLTLSHQIWNAVDWLPTRLTAITFAVVGNFEQAIESWRFYLNRYEKNNDAIILAATAGALDIELGVTPLKEVALQEEVDASLKQQDRVSSTMGQTPQRAHLQAVVGLLWRGVLMWILLVGFTGVSQLFSRIAQMI